MLGDGRWQAGGQVDCPASSFPVVHHLTVVEAHCTFALLAGADHLCPFRQQRAWAICGAMWDGKQLAMANHYDFWQRPFRDAVGERKVGAGICALLFEVPLSPRFPVSSTVTSTIGVL